MKKVKIKTKYVSIAIITVLVLSAFISTLQGSFRISQESQSSTQKENSNYSAQVSSKKVGVEEHKITAAELGKLKSQVGVYEEGQNYNQIVDGYGTGLSPPTSDEWLDIAENAHVIDSISYQSVPSAVDNSATPWFPPIGNQGSQGSCTAWAVGYYVKTFQEAKEHSWNLSGTNWEGGYYGYPTPSYQSKIMSPAFIYHLINDGANKGTNFQDAIQLVNYVGACLWQKMPYNPSDHSTWPSEAAWTEAASYRGNSSYSYQYLYANTDEELSNLKSWLASGNLAVIAVDADQYDYLTSEDVWTTDNYHTVDLNHANTIVGYNDNITYIENGTPHSGAFKIANSWGIGSGLSSWENVPDGFYWISYETMKELSGSSNPCMLFQDIVGYQPEILATFRINHAVRSDCQITFGLGTPASPIATKKFHDYVSGGAFPFCSNNIVLDITEFKSSMTSLYNQPFFMRVYDKGGGTGGGTVSTGTITYFGVGNAISTQTPATTVNNGYVNLTLTYSLASTTLNLSPTSGPPSGIVTLNGAGFTAGSSVNISYLSPCSIWVPIINLATASGNFTYTMNAPDLAQNNLAGDHQPLSDSVIFLAQDNSNGHSYTTAIPYTELRRGLAQIGNSAAIGLYGNNTNLAASVFVQNGQSILVCGEWFSPGNVSLIWDGITNLGTVLSNETGFFNTSVLVPTTTAGPHMITINDGFSDFCVNLTRLPTVTNDYVDLWHTSDFRINLAPDFSVNETFYRINNGIVCNVTANGQPTITTEGSNNTLEYWSTWDIYGTGSMVNPHVILTGIKLDKTAPTSSITINSNHVNSGATVTFDAGGSSDESGIVSYLWDLRWCNRNRNDNDSHLCWCGNLRGKNDYSRLSGKHCNIYRHDSSSDASTYSKPVALTHHYTNIYNDFTSAILRPFNNT
jgi:hypothetical protein